MGINWGEAWAVVFTGVTIVFLVLLLLILIVAIFGKVMTGIGKGSEGPKQRGESQATKVENLPVAPSVTVDMGVTDEEVAAIMAAISMCGLSDHKEYQIRQIKRRCNGKNAWLLAGLRQNIQPF